VCWPGGPRIIERRIEALHGPNGLIDLSKA
jgi:hypothetical protein